MFDALEFLGRLFARHYRTETGDYAEHSRVDAAVQLVIYPAPEFFVTQHSFFVQLLQHVHYPDAEVRDYGLHRVHLLQADAVQLLGSLLLVPHVLEEVSYQVRLNLRNIPVVRFLYIV